MIWRETGTSIKNTMDAVQKTPSSGAGSVHLACTGQPEAAWHGQHAQAAVLSREWLREAGSAEAHTHGQPGQLQGSMQPRQRHTRLPSVTAKHRGYNTSLTGASFTARRIQRIEPLRFF